MTQKLDKLLLLKPNENLFSNSKILKIPTAIIQEKIKKEQNSQIPIQPYYDKHIPYNNSDYITTIKQERGVYEINSNYDESGFENDYSIIEYI